MALTAAALHKTSRYLVYNLFSRRIGAIFSMLLRRAGYRLSASAGFSCIALLTAIQPYFFGIHIHNCDLVCRYAYAVTNYALQNKPWCL